MLTDDADVVRMPVSTSTAQSLRGGDRFRTRTFSDPSESASLEENHVAHTYEELKHKTIAELRDIAKDVQDESVKGYSQMNKDHLLPALCKAFGIESHEHHSVTGIDKAGIKAKIRELKKQRDALLESHDHTQLKSVRRRIHHLNHQIRAHMS
jgi:DNA-binding IclR family transcriptional regulator